MILRTVQVFVYYSKIYGTVQESNSNPEKCVIVLNHSSYSTKVATLPDLKLQIFEKYFPYFLSILALSRKNILFPIIWV